MSLAKNNPPPRRPAKESLEKLYSIAELKTTFEVDGLSKRMRENVLNIDETPIYREATGPATRRQIRQLHGNGIITLSEKITACSGYLWVITTKGKTLADNIRKFNRAMERRSAEILRRKQLKGGMKDAA